jgi:hypothetical protein
MPSIPQGRLDAIKARRAAAPAPPWEIVEDDGEEYYGDWYRIQNVEVDDRYGFHDLVALVSQGNRREFAEFLAHAPDDIDWLISRLEGTRQRELLARLEWVVPCDGGNANCGECPVCWQHRGRGHDSDCWLAAELGRSA